MGRQAPAACGAGRLQRRSRFGQERVIEAERALQYFEECRSWFARGTVGKYVDPVELQLDEDEYVVEAVLKSRKSRKKIGGTEYLIRWQGYGEEADNWEHERHLSCPKLIRAFETRASDEYTVAHNWISGES